MYSNYLPYINVADGLMRLQNNKKLYARLLKSYLATVEIASTEQLLQENNLAAARDKAHSIKGVSANLSVAQNFELAKQLEQILKDGGDYTQTLADLKESMELSVVFIKQLIAEFETV